MYNHTSFGDQMSDLDDDILTERIRISDINIILSRVKMLNQLYKNTSWLSPFFSKTTRLFNQVTAALVKLEKQQSLDTQSSDRCIRQTKDLKTDLGAFNLEKGDISNPPHQADKPDR